MGYSSHVEMKLTIWERACVKIARPNPEFSNSAPRKLIRAMLPSIWFAQDLIDSEVKQVMTYGFGEPLTADSAPEEGANLKKAK